MRRVLAILALLAIIGPMAASAQIILRHDLTTATAASSAGDTGAGSSDFYGPYGEILMLEANVPNLTGSGTVTLSIKDENDIAVATLTSVPENAYTIYQPADLSEWATSERVPITAGYLYRQGYTGIAASNENWSIAVTPSASQEASAEVTLTIWVDTYAPHAQRWLRSD